MCYRAIPILDQSSWFRLKSDAAGVFNETKACSYALGRGDNSSSPKTGGRWKNGKRRGGNQQGAEGMRQRNENRQRNNRNSHNQARPTKHSNRGPKWQTRQQQQQRHSNNNSNNDLSTSAGGSLRQRLDEMDKRRASLQLVEQHSNFQNDRGNKNNGNARGWRRKRGGPTKLRRSPSNLNSPISSGDSSSAASEGRLSELRDIFMSAIEKDREKRVEERLRMEKEVEEKTRFDAEMDPEKRGRVDSWRKVFGGGSDTARPSWRDRSRQKHQEGPSSGGFRGNRSHWDIADERQGKAESESERILREIEKERRQNATANASREDYHVKDEDESSSSVTLPQRTLSLSELSSLMRVRVSKLSDTVKMLGEPVPRNDSEAADYKIDIDIAELAALELGFDPVRAKHGAGHKWKSVEQAENRMRRGVRAEGSDSGVGEEVSKSQEDLKYELLPPRPPVVCIMGHVDHGKTTLMDALRKKAETNESRRGKGAGAKKKKAKKKSKGAAGGIVGDIAGTEAGGITQAISAFQIFLPSNDHSSQLDLGAAVSFLDTPGHAAFKSMRQSGSSGADIIVLVIAADDGVSPQTIEILNTFKSIAESQPGSISLVVALTKIDKPGIKIDESRVMIENQLLEQGILTEGIASGDEDSDYGPPAQLLPVSGMTGEGLDDLIEGLVLQSEIMDLRADEEARCEGVVMDARLERGLGVVVDCIVRWGKLERGDHIVSGVHGGKIKILQDVAGGSVKKARPSQPVRIVGFKSLPKAGDPIVSVRSEETAKELISRREALATQDGSSTSYRAADVSASPELQITGMDAKQSSRIKMVLDRYGMGEERADGTVRIPVIIKADADGSLAAVRDAFIAIGDESKRDIIIDPISMGVGPPTTTDITMAKESGATVFCFGVKGKSDRAATSLAESEGVSVLSNDVIYSLLDQAKDLFASYLPAIPTEKVHGKAEVKAVFDIGNKRDTERVAGLQVTEGSLHLKKVMLKDGETIACHYRIFRKGVAVSQDTDRLQARSLKKFKEEVDSVRRGDECGLVLGFDDVQEGDIIECYSVEMKSVFV